ncbi:MAG: DJ-1/PfpI family protein [Desulfohalobiaceae bacterium]
MARKHILMLAADGVQDQEFSEPLRTLEEDGHQVDVAAPDKGTITAKSGATFQAPFSLAEILERGLKGYDLLLLPGGKGPEVLMHKNSALEIVEAFQAAGKPIAAICHGTLLLARGADIQHRSIASPAGLSEEIRGGGGIWKDQSVVVDKNFITSRGPDDIPDFLREIQKALS